ncbi:MAG: peroxiredoxin-like family protein [Burkholderiales bacterium]
MIHALRFSTLFLASIVPLSVSSAEPATPNLAERVQNFEQNRKLPPISDQDRGIMVKTQQDLTARLNDAGLKVGQKAPEFNLPNAFGKSISLHQQLQTGPVVLVFYRGAWCPFCNLQLHALQEILPQLAQQHATLIAVTPQRPDKSRAQLEKSKYTFEVLSDLDSSAMKAYRLYYEVPAELNDVYARNFKFDLTDYNGAGRLVLPVPATYIIAQDGSISYAYVDVNYKKRSEPAEIIAALEKIKTAKR